MKPQDDHRNGDGAGSAARSRSGSASSSSSSSSGSELELVDEAAPARALAALNALRKARQHYDVLLVAGGAEVPAHGAVLAAAAPRLLAAADGGALDADGAALAALVEWAYTGRLRARRPHAAAVYRAACALRVDALRRPLAERLLAAAAPTDALQLRALPALDADQLRRLDAYIAEHFDEICECGALAALPTVTIELVRETSADDGREGAAAVAHAALAWLRERRLGRDLAQLCARTHLLYVDARGELRDCDPPPADDGAAPAPALDDHDDWAVLGARALGGGGARALLALGGRAVAARVSWRAGGAGGAGRVRGAALGGGGGGPGGERLAPMAAARCALGAAALGGRLLVCGGYDRAHVLRGAEAYDPATNAWAPLADMRGARARFPAAAAGGALLALGGSDGQADLAGVEVLRAGAWRAGPALPLARAHAAAAADARGAVFVLGGLAAGQCLRRVDRLPPADGAAPPRWEDAPPLITGRSQCASVVFEDELWALGGCDAWHCLASTERLALGGAGAGAGWAGGPPLPTARRSAGAAAWRGRLLVVGGSDGAASLRRVDWLAPAAGGWRAGPELRRPRAAHALAELAGALYAVGGFDGKHFLACVEALYQPDGCWTELRAPPSPAPPPPPAPAPDPDNDPDADG